MIYLKSSAENVRTHLARLTQTKSPYGPASEWSLQQANWAILAWFCTGTVEAEPTEKPNNGPL